MQTHISTTPFGRRTITLGQVATQVMARKGAAGASAEKWRVFQHIREARELLGATDRSLAILNALLSFHRGTELSEETGLIVWPSNEQLAARANGVAPATLRRHIAILVNCGLIIRRDSPNGKRFARKGRGGEIEQAFGFDLSPIVARAMELQQLAEQVQLEKKAHRLAKERLTLLRRNIVKMLEAVIEEGMPGNWAGVQQRYQHAVGRLPRTAPRAVMEEVREELEEIAADIRDALESFAESKELSAKESHSERHIHNSNPESQHEYEDRSGTSVEASGGVVRPNQRADLPKRELPLGIVLDACPGLGELMQGDVRHWRDFLAGAEILRPMLGISAHAWTEAVEVLGHKDAAVTLAAIYEKGAAISNAGGYLRKLTARGGVGKFSPWPMVMALLRAKLEIGDAHLAGKAKGRSTDAGRDRLEVSTALRRSLSKSGGPFKKVL